MRPWIHLTAAVAALVLGGCSACIRNDPASLRHRDVGSEDGIAEDVFPETDSDDLEALDDGLDVDGPDDQDTEDVSPDLDVVEDIEIEFTSFVLIDAVDPPIIFTMGAPSGSPGYMDDEVEHTVTLTESFEIMVNEVRQEEYEELMDDNPSYFPGSGFARNPVEQVTWHQAAAYANELSEKDGYSLCYDCTYRVDIGWRCDLSLVWGTPPYSPYDCPGGYRLPTEAEWEYAVRAGTTTSTYNGDIAAEYLYACPPAEEPCPILLPIAWFCGNSEHQTHAVQTRTPNAWGLYDMLGNVDEWCHDWYGTYPGDITDPWGPSEGTERVVRGGSWLDPACLLRSASRDSYVDVASNLHLGFRLVRNP